MKLTHLSKEWFDKKIAKEGDFDIGAGFVLPKTIIRTDDGAEFVLKKNGMYTLKNNLALEKQGYLVWEYSYERLMNDQNGTFKVADGTEDLKAMQKAWFEKCQSHNDGHGDEDDE